MSNILSSAVHSLLKGMRRFAFLIVLFGSLPAGAVEWGGYATVTSDYVKRGVSQSDSSPAVQLGLDISWESGFFAGAWASTVDIWNGPGRQRDAETNLYLGFQQSLGDAWLGSVSVVSYDYPRQTGDVDYAYIEYKVAASYKDFIWIEYAHSPDLYNSGQHSHNIELLAEIDIAHAWTASGGVGHYDVSDLTGEDYAYWQLGATWHARYADIDIRYHDTSKPVFIISTPDRARARIAVSISVPF